MKFWIKISVAVAVVLVIGFAVWAFFFREKDEVVAYNRTEELVEYKDSINIKGKLEEFGKENYIGNDPTKVISSDYEQILEIRKTCLDTTAVSFMSGDNTYSFDSYFVIDSYLDEIVEYYLPYLKATTRIENKKVLTNAINEYVDGLKEFDKELSNIKEFQRDLTEGTPVEFDALKGYYNGFREKYRILLNKYSNVAYELSDFIVTNLFNNQFKIDTKFALYDSYARSAKIATSIEILKEPDYARDLKIIATKIIDATAGSSIYNDVTEEYEFLNSYNLIINEDSSQYDIALRKTLHDKKQMAEGKGMSDIVEKYKSSITQVLKVLGF